MEIKSSELIERENMNENENVGIDHKSKRCEATTCGTSQPTRSFTSPWVYVLIFLFSAAVALSVGGYEAASFGLGAVCGVVITRSFIGRSAKAKR